MATRMTKGLAVVAGRMLRRPGGLGSSSRGLSGEPPSHQLILIEDFNGMPMVPEPGQPKPWLDFSLGFYALGLSIGGLCAYLKWVQLSAKTDGMLNGFN